MPDPTPPALAHDIVADRYVPEYGFLDLVGQNLTSGMLHMQVRDRANGGQIRFDLAQVDNGSGLQGVRLENVTSSNSVFTSRIAWLVSGSSMAALPLNPADPEADLVLEYDIHATPTVPTLGLKYIAARGRFIVRAGVTQ